MRLWVHLFGPEILVGVGLGFALPLLRSTALSNVQPSDSGVISAIMNTTRQIGGSLGIAVLNTVAATITGSYTGVGESNPRIANPDDLLPGERRH